MLASNGQQLISLASLGDPDSILVSPRLDFYSSLLAETRKIALKGDLPESDQDSRSWSLNVWVASEADFDIEACMSAIFKLATRALRRTLAINLSLVDG